MPFEWDDTPVSYFAAIFFSTFMLQEQQAAHFECVRLDEKIANIERDYDAAYAEAWRPFRARLYAQEEAAYAPPRVDDPPLRTIAEYCKMLKDANIHCAFVLIEFAFQVLQFAGGRYDILKAYEKTYDSRSPMQKKLFAIYFAAWSEYQFKLENQDGKMLSFSAPSTIGILLDASNINFFALAPNGCFTFAGTSIIGKRPTVPLNAQG